MSIYGDKDVANKVIEERLELSIYVSPEVFQTMVESSSDKSTGLILLSEEAAGRNLQSIAYGKKNKLASIKIENREEGAYSNTMSKHSTRVKIKHPGTRGWIFVDLHENGKVEIPGDDDRKIYKEFKEIIDKLKELQPILKKIWYETNPEKVYEMIDIVEAELRGGGK